MRSVTLICGALEEHLLTYCVLWQRCLGGVGRRAASVVKVPTHFARRAQVSEDSVIPVLEIFNHHTMVNMW